MAMLTKERLKEMEEEMYRFEQEILAPFDTEPRMSKGWGQPNSYNKVQTQFKMASHPEDYPANSSPCLTNEPPHLQNTVPNMESPHSMLSAPPPPPSGQCPLNNQFTRWPPPPMAQAPDFMPHQFQHRPPMPMQHPMHMGPHLNSNAPGMPPFRGPPPPRMMGGPGHGGPPPHHMHDPMMRPPQRPFMTGPAGGWNNRGPQDPMMTPSINIENPNPPENFRIFCGDLGNGVTDEVLTAAFSEFPSFVKARVVRDKRSNKTKGYGFVSFRDANDFTRAMKEMNGKYVGNRPIKLRQSSGKKEALKMLRRTRKRKDWV